MPVIVYPFHVSERIVFEEIYFPKRAAYYGAIFDALLKGHNEEEVKNYLRRNAKALLEELQEYSVLLDPQEYDADVRSQKQLTVKDARERIDMFRSSFTGWSTYSVDGVFFSKKDGSMYEEATQVIRIMFRFVDTESYKKLQKDAQKAACTDVLRSIVYWVMPRLGRIDEETGWSANECKLYLNNHTAWTEIKRNFAEKHFTAIAKETQRWNDDRTLFLFGYLVRQFWENLVKKKLYEEEIWVTSQFTMNLNVIKRVEQ